MRAAFLRTLGDLAARDPRIVLLTGDLGFSVIETYADRWPDRFVNVGVAEQNMVGIATGLAEAGFLPFVYSIATFATLRPYEFIRNGPVSHGLPVRIVGVGGGFEYGTAGFTHHGLEDIAVMRVLPGMTVIAPADSAQAEAALTATWDLPGPIYFRLGKQEDDQVPGLAGAFRMGRIEQVHTGDDVAIVTTGAIACEAARAVNTLDAEGIAVTLLVVSTISPAPRKDLLEALSKVRLAVTVEAHSVIGGLGSLVAEVIAENAVPCRLVRIGVDAIPDGISGSEAYLNDRHGLSSSQIATRVRELLEVSS